MRAFFSIFLSSTSLSLPSRTVSFPLLKSSSSEFIFLFCQMEFMRFSSHSLFHRFQFLVASMDAFGRKYYRIVFGSLIWTCFSYVCWSFFLSVFTLRCSLVDFVFLRIVVFLQLNGHRKKCHVCVCFISQNWCKMAKKNKRDAQERREEKQQQQPADK